MKKITLFVLWGNFLWYWSLLNNWLFCGIGFSAIAFTLQMETQKYLHPVTATLLMSLESVFAAVGGWLFLKEQLSVRELIGCGVIFLAVILAQIPFPQKIFRKSANQ